MTASYTQTPELDQLLRQAGSMNRNDALVALHEFAKALELPLRQGVLNGDILDGIYEPIQLNGTPPEFPLDFLAPGTEKDFVAYTMPNHGYIPQRNVEGDFVMVPTYDIGSSIDWLLKYARNARWDIVGRAMEVLEASFTKKLNDDGWHTIISAAVDRNIIVFDSDAVAGQFTKRLVSLAKTVMRRNGGGNSTSMNRGMLTDVYLSPEALEDIRNWNVDQVDEVTRREIFVAEDGSGPMSRVFGINLHDIDELGEGQEYQLFYTSQLSGTLPTSDVEILVGLDLRKNDSFVMPIDEPLQVFEDQELHRQRRAGLYAWQSQGFANLDNRRSVLLSI
uniref:Capsid protein n=1 Tax=viral metagenome TaxID=1070528 RepID=A0A6M3K590_9ZZZZ